MAATKTQEPPDYVFNPGRGGYEALPPGWQKFGNIYHRNGRKICFKEFPDGEWALIWLRGDNRFRSFRKGIEGWHPSPLPGNRHPSRFTSIKRGCELMDKRLG